ncbi:putative acetyltransferase [Nocardioides daedukensis]|uniref:Putative acetyltransferase n=1 Tax=Nocardioides daedukensis TaxID=634462 RepID=A0A7Y9RZW6_9ACTN|nr:GNAT family N-acetyltransferase [Nocardioides daedukensis]NYG59707.1 putative acetyltransferase [Nocardioides daedukensis]
MTELITPDLQWYDEWRAAYDEFGGVHMDGSGYFGTPPPEPSRDDYAAMVENRLAQGDPSTQMDPGMVHCSFFWITEQDSFIGWLAIRHALNDFLLEQGGHIGYSVRPSRRREGHASRALGLAVPLSRELGIDRILLTCDADNDASRRTIEANGGVFEDERVGKLRYWIG